MNSGVSKSGSPAPKPQTSSPAAFSSFALASTASVGEGAMFVAQVDSFACSAINNKKRSRSIRQMTEMRERGIKAFASAKASLA